MSTHLVPPAFPARRGRKPDQKKREAIFEAAHRLFMSRGYGASVDAIAAEAGVSKQTVYKAFPAKVELFAAIAGRISDGITAPLDQAHADALTPAEVLTELARHIFEVVYAESSIALHRVLIAERTQFPELASTFYRVGPGATRVRLAEYLARETARGRLNAPEPDMAAEHFLGLLTGHSYMRRLLGLEAALSDDAKARRIEAAVKGFLRAYAV
jgi:TetR/AcrR family transcriptional repressor of mexJK operon